MHYINCIMVKFTVSTTIEHLYTVNVIAIFTHERRNREKWSLFQTRKIKTAEYSREELRAHQWRGWPVFVFQLTELVPVHPGSHWTDYWLPVLLPRRSSWRETQSDVVRRTLSETSSGIFDTWRLPLLPEGKPFSFFCWALLHSCQTLCSTTTAPYCHYVAICLPSVAWRVQAEMPSYALIIPHPQNTELHIQIVINDPLVCCHDSSFQDTVAWTAWNPALYQSHQQKNNSNNTAAKRSRYKFQADNRRLKEEVKKKKLVKYLVCDLLTSPQSCSCSCCRCWTLGWAVGSCSCSAPPPCRSPCSFGSVRPSPSCSSPLI